MTNTMDLALKTPTDPLLESRKYLSRLSTVYSEKSDFLISEDGKIHKKIA